MAAGWGSVACAPHSAQLEHHFMLISVPSGAAYMPLTCRSRASRSRQWPPTAQLRLDWVKAHIGLSPLAQERANRHTPSKRRHER